MSALAVGAVALLAACGGSSSSTTATTGMQMPDDLLSGPCGTSSNPIKLSGMSFTPKSCTVSAGQTVFWTWAGGTHSVTSDPTSPVTFDSMVNSSPHNFQFVVPASTASGTTLPFHCQIHGNVSTGTCTGMCGTLDVE